MIPSRLRLGALAFAMVVLAPTGPNPLLGMKTLQARPARGLTTQGEKHPLQSLPYTPGLDLNSMDRSADPCVDFYQFVCGGWMKNNPIPPPHTSLQSGSLPTPHPAPPRVRDRHPFPQGGEGIVKSYSQCDQNHELALHRLTMIPKSGLKRSVSDRSLKSCS